MPDDLDLSSVIRDGLLSDGEITSRLATYAGGRAIFTRRPVPSDASYPMVVISSDISVTDEDGIADDRPVIIRDVIAYGHNDTAEHYRTVEEIGYAMRRLFHRNKEAIGGNASPALNYAVVDVRAAGPRPAPTDDQNIVGRLVQLTVRLARLSD